MKKILLVADMKGWVFERHCREIQKRLRGEFHIGIEYARGWRVAKGRPYDLVYFLDPFGLEYPNPKKCIIGLRCEFLHLNHPGGARGLYEDGSPGACSSIRDKCSLFHVVNQNQMKVFAPIVTDKPLMCVPHGVDESVFDMNKYLEQHKDPDGEFVVGVSGRAASDGNKGFKVVKKVCDALDLRLLKTSYKGKRLSKEEMPGKFYKKIDVYVCMSESEGVNNPILEAGAMGVPVISTKSGAAPEIIENMVNGILINRNYSSLYKALDYISDSSVDMGIKLYETIMESWSWKVRINGYRDMFNRFFGEQRT